MHDWSAGLYGEHIVSICLRAVRYRDNLIQTCPRARAQRNATEKHDSSHDYRRCNQCLIKQRLKLSLISFANGKIIDNGKAWEASRSSRTVNARGEIIVASTRIGLFALIGISTRGWWMVTCVLGL